jgi:hypothetical protein
MTFGCQDGSLPFTYLGLPVETTRPNIEHFEVMVHRVERRLISTSMFLSQADKLELDKSVLSSLPTYLNKSTSIEDMASGWGQILMLRNPPRQDGE